MAEKIRITTPLTEEVSRTLRAGDSVLISGTIYSARDAAHKAMTEAGSMELCRCAVACPWS